VPLAAELHAALRSYPGELPFLAMLAFTVPSCLALLEANPDLIAPPDLERAQHEWAVLGPLLSSATAFAAAFPHAILQPIHGDAPSYNLIHTTRGIRHADFEDVTLGPVEWDLAGLGPEAADAYDAAAERLGSRTLDRDALRVVETGRMLQTVACLALVPQLPMLATGLTPILEQWRAAP
jgi:Ser/Thr protein kinase RdoA (MazF antagonist)